MNIIKNKEKYLLIAALILFFVASCRPTDHKLFQENGTDWKAYGNDCWHFSNNELIGKIIDAEGYVITKEKFKNFDLTLEFKPDSTINSGIFIRCHNEDMNPKNCYEINIWDLHPDQSNRTGAIVGRTETLAKVETINKWNTYRITARDEHIQIWINNILVIDAIDHTLTEGYIGLQAKATGKVHFRNININTID
ncbi:DUF1080 domain-containing protein [Winogradskyella eckloniae]|uniref:3-keto-disaccharide hydrolase n=1 Tax=Winogradskyella eckloniae TaxID=1089306 RepID=UPI0015661E92|nr:DUF1080 domain-containing protein [Winogradskyella eckloniae]NRD19977.1 DUF1080 domain-containing protein [Winogradskyella eckloniae]